LLQADSEELREFVEELTSMARTGQSLSIISGFHLAWWGGLVALTSLVSLLAVTNDYPLEPVYIWPASMFIGWVGNSLLHKKLNLSARQGALAYVNRVTSYTWATVGLVATLVVFAEAGQMIDFGGRAYFVVFLLCGIGLVVTSAAGTEPLLLLAGVGWLLIAFVSLFFSPQALISYCLTMIACVVFLVLPGLIIGVRQA